MQDLLSVLTTLRSHAEEMEVRMHPTRVLDPLSTVGIRTSVRLGGTSSAPSGLAGRPLVLRGLRPAPEPEVPEYVYDPQRQIATDPSGVPLEPRLEKRWTTVSGTHTDGDGGDNELWDWEE